MNSLDSLCDGVATGALDVDALRVCIDEAKIFSITLTEGIVIGAAAVLGLVCGLLFGKRNRLSATLEGFLLAPLAVYFATLGAAFFAKWIPPTALGVWFVFLAVSGVVLTFIAWFNGKEGVGWRLLGTLEVLLFVAAYSGVAVAAFILPSGPNAADAYQFYLSLVTWIFVITAVVDVLFAAAHGSYSRVLSWLIVPMNASWGALGNLSGVMHHLLSWHFFADHGDVDAGKRKFYTSYRSGLRLRYGDSPFAFTQGAVMTGPPVEVHESHHVLQHLIFGPIFVVSYVLWFVPAGIIGFFVGIFKGKGLNGVEAWAYFNNPWEVWAYAVEGGRSQSHNDTSLIWGPVCSWVIAISYFVLATTAFVLLLGLHYQWFE